MDFLSSVAIFLGASLIAVPLFKKLKLGSILGYLIAGIIIGPSVLNLVSDPYTILHFAELGVVLLLFVIGLELEPSILWRMRNQILLSGGSQLIITAGIISGVCLLLLSIGASAAVTIGLGLALSSTAFAIQLMSEQRILKTPPGQQGFSILLMQDVAVIPILLIVAALSPITNDSGPAWYVSILAVVGVLIVGRFLINPFLRMVAKAGSAEVMTAAALFIVLVTALAMYKAGLSMGMGAFIAGILLSESAFKHQLETEIEPFKGLLLGLFFIAIGMNLDLALLVREPVFIVIASLALVFIKTAVIFAILRFAKQTNKDASRIALMLSQGGEFAFVVMTLAVSSAVLEIEIANQVNLIVGISMAITSPVVILHSMFFSTKNCPAVYDNDIDEDEPAILIAGFGRFGQITARILAANNIRFTALDKDAEHIEFVKQFGNKVFFGDATRLDLLKTAGIGEARVMLIAIDDMQEINALVKLVKDEYPELHLVVRARNRIHAAELARLGVSAFVREMFLGGLDASKHVLQAFGYTDLQSDQMAQMFVEHDVQQLDKVIEKDMKMDELITTAKDGRAELKSLFLADKQRD